MAFQSGQGPGGAGGRGQQHGSMGQHQIMNPGY